MAVRWQCEQCDRVRILPDHANLRIVRCVRCGCRTGTFLTEAAEPTDAADNAEMPHDAVEDADELIHDLAQSVRSTKPQRPRARHPAASRDWSRFVAIGVAAVLLIVVVVIIIPHLRRKPELTWEQQNTPQIELLMAQAERSRLQDTAEQAFERYEALFEFIRDQQFTNHELVERLNAAAADRRQLADQIRQMRYEELVSRQADRTGSAESNRRAEADLPAGEAPGLDQGGKRLSDGDFDPPDASGGTDSPSEIEVPALRIAEAPALAPQPALDDEPVRSPLEGIERPADAETARRMDLELLIEQGMVALAARQWTAALDALHDAVQLVDTRSPDSAADDVLVEAFSGLAVGYIHIGRFPAAGEFFQDTSVLGRALGRSPTRELVINRAILDLVQRFQVMRSVRGLCDFLAADPGPPDELAADLLGTAIFVAEQRGQQNRRILDDARAFYGEYNRRLEAQRPGMRRWGVRWVSEQEYQSIQRQREQRVRVYEAAEARVRSAQNELRAATEWMQGLRPRNVTLQQAEQRWQRARGQLESARREAQAARAQIPQPPWLDRAEPLLPPMAQRLLAPPPAVVATTSGPAASSPPPRSDPPPEPVSPIEPVIPSEPPRDVTPAPEPAPAERPRRVVRYAAAFPVDRFRLLTAAAPLENAVRVFIEDTQGRSYPARVAAHGAELALLEVDRQDVGERGLPYLPLAAVATPGPVQCIAMPTPSVFNPSIRVLDGHAPAPRAEQPWRISLSAHPRLSGSPVIDPAGAVVGVVIASRDDAPGALPAVPLEVLRSFLREHNSLPDSGGTPGNLLYQVMAVH